MPKKTTIDRAKRDLAQGKKPSTAAGEFVREEIEHVRQGEHGARSPQQAIAIGLSKARRAGVPLPPPPPGRSTERTRRSAERDYETGQGLRAPRSPSRRRARAVEVALDREPGDATSREKLAAQTRSAAARRSKADRSRAASLGSATKGPIGRSKAAQRAAAARQRRSHT